MESNLILLALNNNFEYAEKNGNVPNIEICILLYLMFIDEYYEVIRDITLNDSSDPRGLNDNLVKQLNNKIKQIVECSNMINDSLIEYLQSVLFWIIPDIKI